MYNKNEREELWATSKEFSTSKYENNKLDRRTWMLEKLCATKPRTVLEIGCFGGYNLRIIKDIDPSISITGFDINKKALEYAKERLPSANYICGSIHNLQDFFCESDFDCVFTMGVLIHISSEEISHICNQILKMATKNIFHGEEHSEQEEHIPGKIVYGQEAGKLAINLLTPTCKMAIPNLTQQQRDQLAKLLETNQASEVKSFLVQVFNAAQAGSKNINSSQRWKHNFKNLYKRSKPTIVPAKWGSNGFMNLISVEL